MAAGGAATAAEVRSLAREYPDNRLALQLFGSHHVHLARIEHGLGVRIDTRGNRLTIMGAPGAAAAAAEVLDHLYGRLERGLDIGDDDVDAAVRMTASQGGVADAETAVHIRHRSVVARTPTQASYVRAIDRDKLVFGLGPAGTGKTYLAVAKAVERLVNGEVDRIILSRPAVEA
ncbi:MAG: PhoH family protein, partial [Rhodospirillales bacterium]|nr:PhoH family protein [Rhodospirillales bacterium]